MLVCRGVEHYFRTVFFEDRPDPRHIRYVPDQRNDFALYATITKIAIDRVKGIFVALKHQQETDIERVQLSAEFRTDRAAGAGHQYAPAFDESPQWSGIEPHWAALKQIFKGDITNLTRGYGAVEHVPQTRQRLDRQLVWFQRADDVAQKTRL